MAQPAIVGQPVVVNNQMGGDMPKTGPYYNPTVQASLTAGGDWSDGMFQCFDEAQSCFLSCCCPCIQMYFTLDRIGSVSSMCGTLDKTKVLFVYMVIFVFQNYISPSTPVLYTVPTQQGSSSIEYRYSIVTVGGVLSTFLFSILFFVVIKGVKDKLRINESDGITFLKVCECPMFCLCWSCCALAQMARHVDRAQGFIAANGGQMQPQQMAGQMQQQNMGGQMMGQNPQMQPIQGQIVMAQPVQAQMVMAQPVMAQPIMGSPPPVMGQPLMAQPQVAPYGGSDLAQYGNQPTAPPQSF